jgi:hypothetical protein
MALTDDELQRVTDIESAINSIQTYVTNLASKTVVRQLNILREQGIADLNTKIDNISTTGSNELTVDDLGIFATKEQMKQLLLLNQQEISEIKDHASASGYLRTMEDVTIHEPPEAGQILRFDLVDGWENADLSTAGLASAIHSHNIESLSNVSSAGLESGFILQYNGDVNPPRWEASEANMAQIINGPEGSFAIYNSDVSVVVPLTTLTWDSLNSILEIGDLNTTGSLTVHGQLTLRNTEIKGEEVNIPLADIFTSLDIFNYADYRTVKYLIEIKNEDGNYCSQEILLVHNAPQANLMDQEVYISEYGVIFTSEDNFTTFTAEMDTGAGTITLSCKCTGPNNVAKITRIVMTA